MPKRDRPGTTPSLGDGSARALGHTVQLLQLDPYPDIPGPAPSEPYVAHLRVTTP